MIKSNANHIKIIHLIEVMTNLEERNPHSPLTNVTMEENYELEEQKIDFTL